MLPILPVMVSVCASLHGRNTRNSRRVKIREAIDRRFSSQGWSFDLWSGSEFRLHRARGRSCLSKMPLLSLARIGLGRAHLLSSSASHRLALCFLRHRVTSALKITMQLGKGALFLLPPNRNRPRMNRISSAFIAWSCHHFVSVRDGTRNTAKSASCALEIQSLMALYGGLQNTRSPFHDLNPARWSTCCSGQGSNVKLNSRFNAS